MPPPRVASLAQHAVDVIIAQCERHAGELVVVATGPLTNLAIGLRKAPHIAGAIRRCVVMGGAIRHEGNMPLRSEYNVFCDPHAAHIVLHSGLPLTLVPLDVTYRCLFHEAHLQALRDRVGHPSPIVDFIADATRSYIAYHRTAQGVDGCAVNDPLALALTFAPDLVQCRDLFVDVELGDGPAHAVTAADFFAQSGRPPNACVALEVDAARFMECFLQRIAALSLSRLGA